MTQDSCTFQSNISNARSHDSLALFLFVISIITITISERKRGRGREDRMEAVREKGTEKGHVTPSCRISRCETACPPCSSYPHSCSSYPQKNSPPSRGHPPIQSETGKGKGFDSDATVESMYVSARDSSEHFAHLQMCLVPTARHLQVWTKRREGRCCTILHIYTHTPGILTYEQMEVRCTAVPQNHKNKFRPVSV